MKSNSAGAMLASPVAIRPRAVDSRRIARQERERDLDPQRLFRLRTRELALAREEIEAFATSVSHDLRAPVALVRNFSQVLLDGCALEESARTHVARISAAADHMKEIIEALLGLASIGERRLAPCEIDVERMAREVAAECAGASGREVRVDMAVTARLFADPGLLRVVLSNLLGNAWKFTGQVEHPRIVVECTRRADDEVALSVSDNGIGFDASQSSELFRPFQRLHAHTDFPGLGIGLPTVHRIVQRHGGWIETWGEPGRGARFTVVMAAHEPDLTHACRACEARDAGQAGCPGTCVP